VALHTSRAVPNAPRGRHTAVPVSAHHNQTAASSLSDSDTQRHLTQQKTQSEQQHKYAPAHGRLCARRHRLVPGRARRRAALDHQAPPARRALQARGERTHLRTHQPRPCPALHESTGPRCDSQREAGRMVRVMGSASYRCSLHLCGRMQKCEQACRTSAASSRHAPA